MIYKLIIALLVCDSLLPIISLIKGYLLGKYVIKNNLNRLEINDLYIENSILGTKYNLKLINSGYLLYFLFFIPYIFIQTNYFKNSDENIYYLNNIYKYYNNSNNLYSWLKLGFNLGQLIYYNKN